MGVVCKNMLFSSDVQLSHTVSPTIKRWFISCLGGHAQDFTWSNLISNCLATYTVHSQERGHPQWFFNKSITDMSFQQHNPELAHMQIQPKYAHNTLLELPTCQHVATNDCIHGRHDGSLKVKPKRFSRPLMAGCNIGIETPPPSC